MYCRKCYANLKQTAEFNRCGRCGRAFDPGNPKTYLSRPFPGNWKIARQILWTTIIGVMAAYVVATFQMASLGAGGH